jgi:hypothetical protein
VNKKIEKMIVLLFIETISDLKKEKETVDHKNVTLPARRMTYQRNNLSIC